MVIFVFVLFFFLVRDPFILVHAIGALLYFCKIKLSLNALTCVQRHIIKTLIQFLGAAATNYSVVPWGGAAFNTTQFSREELVIHIADI